MAECCCSPQEKPYTTDAVISFADRLGALRVRLGIGRNSFRVKPGLYTIGAPEKTSPVFVTANYKLSFDSLRAALPGINAWILVLDTKGINVWCAAGKGTFGTKELIKRITSSRLGSYISHKTIILPQLGAPGVAAHVVKQQTGFTVVYGPVRARDIPVFLRNNMHATNDMRRVSFTIADRAVLIPVEMRAAFIPTLIAAAACALVFAVSPAGITPSVYVQSLAYALIVLIGALVSGSMLTPLLLPFIPVRSFALKGFIVSLPVATLAFLLFQNPFTAAGIALYALAAGAFFALNFTGSSTYTSLSGVQKEMRVALPFAITGASLSLLLVITSRFLGGNAL
ncbi:MAG: acetyl-CoA synthase subunit gamma [Spirochaetes bacterium]|nr:acetyl-CoA synthase subunit gamma [Spirochaetota bacterium]